MCMGVVRRYTWVYGNCQEVDGGIWSCQEEDLRCIVGGACGNCREVE